MLDNIDRLFDREQQMYQIIGKTDQLNQEAFQFKKGAVTLKKNLFWKRVRCTCYIIIILLVCFIFILKIDCCCLYCYSSMRRFQIREMYSTIEFKII